MKLETPAPEYICAEGGLYNLKQAIARPRAPLDFPPAPPEAFPADRTTQRKHRRTDVWHPPARTLYRIFLDESGSVTVFSKTSPTGSSFSVRFQSSKVPVTYTSLAGFVLWRGEKQRVSFAAIGRGGRGIYIASTVVASPALPPSTRAAAGPEGVRRDAPLEGIGPHGGGGSNAEVRMRRGAGEGIPKGCEGVDGVGEDGTGDGFL